MSRIISFGEYMLRLSPPGHFRFTQTQTLEMVWGGAEANTCAALAQLGLDAAFVTSLPDNDIGQSGINELRRLGVDTSHIIRSGDRAGVYYFERGASVRASQVIYDRKHSSAAEADPGSYDWKAIMSGGDWFHTTGISLAVSENARTACFDAAKEAKRCGLRISFDINYRSKLWDIKTAGEVIKRFLPFADVLFCGYDDLEPMFGITSPLAGNDPDAMPDSAYLDVSRQIYSIYSIPLIVFSMRRTISADETVYGLRVYDSSSDTLFDSSRYNIHIVDRIGAGDAADAGVIYSLITGGNPAEAAEFGAACGAIKHTVEGDATAASKADVEAVLRGGLRVKR